MARPARNASPGTILSRDRAFFVTTKTSMSRRLLQPDRNATLLIEILRAHVAAGRFRLHDFVIMPDHVHLLMTVPANMSIERAVQLIKGGFSFRLRREFGYLGEVWQRGFSEVRIMDEASFSRHRSYIFRNPVKAGLVSDAEEWPYCYHFLATQKAQQRKPPTSLKP